MKPLSICILMLLSINIFAFEGQPKNGLVISPTGEEVEFFLSDFDKDQLYMTSCDTTGGRGVASFITRSGEKPVLRYGDQYYYAENAKVYYSTFVCSYKFNHQIVLELTSKAGERLDFLLDILVHGYDIEATLFKGDDHFNVEIYETW